MLLNRHICLCDINTCIANLAAISTLGMDALSVSTGVEQVTVTQSMYAIQLCYKQNQVENYSKAMEMPNVG